MSSVHGNHEQLRRTLSERHIQMIALGGAIGVGLFYGSATTIKMAGPAITLGYILGGLVIFILVSSAIILLVVALNYFIPGRVFIIVSAITTFAVVITWTSILITQLYFRKALSAEQIKQLTFKMPAHKLLSVCALLFLGMILVLMYFIPDMRFALIIGPLWLLLLYAGFRIKSSQAENA